MMWALLEEFRQWVHRNPGKALGVIGGCVLAVLTMAIGVMRLLFILVCAAAGYYVGARIDDGQTPGEVALSLVDRLCMLLSRLWRW